MPFILYYKLISGSPHFADVASDLVVRLVPSLTLSSKYSVQDVVCRSQPLTGLTINGAAATNTLSAIDTGTTLMLSLYNAIPDSFLAWGSTNPAYRM